MVLEEDKEQVTCPLYNTTLTTKRMVYSINQHSDVDVGTHYLCC